MSDFKWSYLPARSGLKFYRGDPSQCDLIVVHCTQGSTAAGAANWFRNPAARGSAHVSIDDDEGIRSAHDTEGTYHAKGHNSKSFGIEIAGFAQWSKREWKKHEVRITEAARFAASLCRKYDMNPGPAQIIGGRRRNGITFHRDCPGNDHWDPGPNFPYEFFFEMVDKFYKGEGPNMGAEWPPPKDASLRLACSDGRRWAGWDNCLGPMRNIAKLGLNPESEKVWAISWSGSIWNGKDEVTFVCKNLVNRVDRYNKTGEWK